MKYIYLLLVFAMVGMISIASAETVSQLPSPNGNASFLSYNIQLNKTSTVGIFSFNLTGTYNGVNESDPNIFSNCTITNHISCDALFISFPGQYNNMEVLISGNFYENISLPIAISYTPHPNNTLHIVSNNSLYYAIIEAAIAILIAGNVFYLIMHRRDLYKFSKGLKI